MYSGSSNRRNSNNPFEDSSNLIDLDNPYGGGGSGIGSGSGSGGGIDGGRDGDPGTTPFHNRFAIEEEEVRFDSDSQRSEGPESRRNSHDDGGNTTGFFANRLRSGYVGMENPFDDSNRATRATKALAKAPAEPERDFDIRKWFRRSPKLDDSTNAGPRKIHIMDPSANSGSGFYGNHISTTKYNIATFFPKFLFEQFSKYANLFFLFTSIIQQVPDVSPTNRYTTIGTLLVVLLVSAIKEVLEDIKRARADSELNNTRVLVLDSNSGEFVNKKWIKVQVGDIVKVTNEQPIPADLLLLSSSEPEGLCYVETSNLDGETNLKIKQSKTETSYLVNSRFLVQDLASAEIMSEPPNSSLYTYEGNLRNFGSTQDLSMSPSQLLLRGATLKNTQWIHGVVIFTGHETKLMRNATATPIKRTDVERIINLQIIILFGILIALSLIATIGNVIKSQVDRDALSYLYLEGTNMAVLFFKDLLTYFILFSNLVPISLFVTVEIIKFYQAYMIGSDLDMYYEETDTPTGVRTSSLVEELGQIDYIFSDKTGTLTRNIMEFKACSIGGRCYIEEIPEDGEVQIVDGIETGYHTFQEMALELHDTNNQQSAIINEFLTLLSACHTVIPDVNEETGDIKYQAASPDEGALVQGAADLGYKFTIRRPKGITIENTLTGLLQEYELLNICEFNSTRKRMSAIFRCPDGAIRLFCKGADTVILERLSELEEQPFVASTLRHLEEFAADGLRTLCIASKIILEQEYQTWASQYYEASTSLDNRQDKMDDVAEEIEHDLFLLGATAIEDKLQDGVPETIQTLQTAGIKLWVLTGDRQETAINIGMSCKLLSEDMNLLIINEDTKRDTYLNLEEKLDAIMAHQENEDSMGILDSSLALIIDGSSLKYALDDDLQDMFIELASRCKAVICCRVSPLQKALVVKMVKSKKKKSLLLAVGDGANDVSMIQAAHVGVGISGLEGMQAARSADISIGQFKYLRKLLLVHGSWCYQRTSNAILYSFYKNIALFMVQFWYVFVNGFSGQSMMESWSLTFYNVLFTVFPPFILGVFDQFVNARLLDRYPQLYQLGQSRKFFNVTVFWGWVANGFYHSALLFICGYFIYRPGNQLATGEVVNNWTWGTAVFTAATLTVLGKAALVVTVWTKVTLLAIPGSFLLWLVFFPPYSIIAPLINVSQEFRGVLLHTYPLLTFWATTFGVAVLCLLRDFAWKYYKRSNNPESYHHVQEMQKFNIQDYRPRMNQFQKAIRKVRQVQRIKKQRGFAFSQVDDQNQGEIVRLYDTTRKRGEDGVRHGP